MRDFLKSEKYKRVIIAFVVTFTITLVTFAVIFISYTQKLKSTSESLSSITNTTTISNSEDSEESSLASSTEDKDVNEAINEVLNNLETQTNTVQGETSNTVSTESTQVAENTNTQENIDEQEENTVETVEEPEPVSFIAPVSGEIITDYAEDSLIFSNTLQEWTTHLGIDIKADKASVVVASEDGVVKSIKNDPRYGLTITISHNENFETVYSNLLSSEFVSEGDEVKQGQTIGTVGESASFEVADVPHLHFEMYKDGEVVNPTIYLSE